VGLAVRGRETHEHIFYRACARSGLVGGGLQGLDEGRAHVSLDVRQERSALIRSDRFRPIADIRISVDAVAMRGLWILVYGAAIASIALLTGREVIDAGLFVYQGLPSRMASLAVVGWLISTFGPLALSIGVWGAARWLQRQWVLHLVFIPCAIVLDRAGASILFYAADVPDGDSVEGRTLIAAFGFLALTLLVHAAALATLAVGKISRRASVG